MLNAENYGEPPLDAKIIFDEIAAELADALRNIKRIECGISKMPRILPFIPPI